MEESGVPPGSPPSRPAPAVRARFPSVLRPRLSGALAGSGGLCSGPGSVFKLETSSQQPPVKPQAPSLAGFSPDFREKAENRRSVAVSVTVISGLRSLGLPSGAFALRPAVPGTSRGHSAGCKAAGAETQREFSSPPPPADPGPPGILDTPGRPRLSPREPSLRAVASSRPAF